MYKLGLWVNKVVPSAHVDLHGVIYDTCIACRGMHGTFSGVLMVLLSVSGLHIKSNFVQIILSCIA